MVREFHEAFGHPVQTTPNLDDTGLCGLRVSLLDEELQELTEAMVSGDPVATLDALCDLQYVLDGAFLALGFHKVKDAAMQEIHRSNMSKLGSDGKPIKRGDGKILKGPNFTPPDLGQFI